METKGYIPEGGVWTREEREGVIADLTRYPDAPPTAFLREVGRGAETVAALLVALKDLAQQVERGGDPEDLNREEALGYLLEAREIANEASALIAEVEK